MNMKNIITALLTTVFVLTSCDSLPDEITRSENDGSVKISVYPDLVEKDLSIFMTGFNMSFYHDTDQLWADGKIINALKDVRAGMLRFPGGNETSFYHWEYPGSPGYLDVFNPEHKEQIEATIKIEDTKSKETSNMDTDEFIAVCRQIGAEPLLGINILSGIQNKREQESLDEAVRWVQYCKDKGYNVKYWYLDNEVNSPGAYGRPLYAKDYAGYIERYSKALKAVDPDIKLVANLLHSDVEDKKELISRAGKYFDILDLHFYYGWDVAEWNKWIAQRPMIDMDVNMSYTNVINNLGSYIKSSENPNIELACLEWNIAPTKAGILSDYQQALMQTEMFQQFLQSDLKMACVWPLIWSVDKGTFPSILTQDEHSPTPLYQILKLYSEVLGNKQVFGISSDMRIVPQCITGDKNSWVCAINKSKYEIPVKIEMKGGRNYSNAKVNIVSAEDINDNQCKVSEQEVSIKGNIISFTVPAFSFFRVDLQ